MKLVGLESSEGRVQWINPIHVVRVNAQQSGVGSVVWFDTDESNNMRFKEPVELVVAMVNYELATEAQDQRAAAERLKKERDRYEEERGSTGTGAQASHRVPDQGGPGGLRSAGGGRWR